MSMHAIECPNCKMKFPGELNGPVPQHDCKPVVNHPTYYGGADNPYEAIRVIEAWDLDFCLGNTVKYISRAGKKDPAKLKEDLEKALWYLQRRIEQIE